MRKWNDIVKDEILVSVIMPAYNSAKYITTALDSALIQDVPLEVIIINDCSTDNLMEVMRRYEGDARIRMIHNPVNLGVSKSRNKGVAEARGNYIAFLDADDQWLPGKLRKQLKLIEEKNMVLCSTGRELMNPDGTLTGQIIPVKEHITYGELKLQNFINCSSVLIRRDVALEFPMHHDDGHEDYLMWLEVLEKYGECCAVNEPLLRYRLSSTGKSGTKLNSARMTYITYRHKGFGLVRSCGYFICYAIHGSIKYCKAMLLGFFGEKTE